MKNKKGFTLIELLAVIVILAIIALIVTPVVSNIVANARIAANARSVEGHIRNIELAIITKAFGENSTGDLDSFDTITSGATIESSLSRSGNDNVTCTSYTIKHGTVLSASGCKDSENKWSKTYNYTNTVGAVVAESGNSGDEPTVTFNGTYVAPVTGDTHKGIVYMNPKDYTTECTASNTNVEGESNNELCMKFYIYDNSGSDYKMILDRNTTANTSAYNKTTYLANGGIEEEWYIYNETDDGALEHLASDTSGWIGTARLITADEIAAIVEKENWNSSTATTNDYFYFGSKSKTDYSSQTDAQKAVQQSYHWLFDYTDGCEGCNIVDESTYGYWTSSAVSGNTNIVWFVNYYGLLNSSSAIDTYYGVRPVLIIPKSTIGV